MTIRRDVVVASTTAYLLAISLVILLHETSHAVAGILQGSSAFQLPFAVDYRPPLSENGSIIAAAVGPLFSLISGLALIGFRPLRARPFWGLTFSWFAFLSAEEGFGYFTISAMGAGDTSEALGLLHAPFLIYLLCTLFGIAGLLFLASRWVSHVLDFSADLDDYRGHSFHTWIAGTVIFTALMTLYLVLAPTVGAGNVVAVLLGAFALGVFAPLSFIFRRRMGDAGYLAIAPRITVPAAGWVVLGLLVVADLILTRGVNWG